MEQENKLRKTLQEYYDSKPEPYKEEDWRQASAMLEAQRRKKRSWFFFPLLLALTGSLVFALQYLPGYAEHTNRLSENKRTKMSPTSDASVLSHQDKPKVYDQSPQAIGNHNTPQSSLRVHQCVEEVAATVKEDENRELINSAENTEKKLPLATIDNPPETAAPEENTPVLIADNDDSGINQTSLPEITKVDSEKENLEETSEGENKIAVKVIVSNNQEKPLASLSKSVEQLTGPLGQSTANPLDEEQTQTETIVTEFSATIDEAYAATAHKPAENFSTADSAATEDEINDSLPLKARPSLKSGLFFEAGGAWLYGWKGSDHVDARGLSPIAGIHYMKLLNGHAALSFGVQYLQINNLSNASKTSRVLSYHYSEYSSVTVITPSSVQYLVAPFRYHYIAGYRNSFSAGINLAYLLNVDANVTTYDEKPGSTLNKKTVTLSGYTQGFSWYDCHLTLGYRRRLARPLSFQAEIFWGITDVKDDAFFGSKAREMNSGVKLTLIYHPF